MKRIYIVSNYLSSINREIIVGTKSRHILPVNAATKFFTLKKIYVNGVRSSETLQFSVIQQKVFLLNARR